MVDFSLLSAMYHMVYYELLQIIFFFNEKLLQLLDQW